MRDQDEEALAQEVLSELEQLRNQSAPAKDFAAVVAKASLPAVRSSSYQTLDRMRADAWLAICGIAQAIERAEPDINRKWDKVITATRAWLHSTQQ